jgi:hypothetical protein
MILCGGLGSSAVLSSWEISSSSERERERGRGGGCHRVRVSVRAKLTVRKKS